MLGCVDLGAFRTVQIISLNRTRASLLLSQFCPHPSATIVQGVRPSDTGCAAPTGAHGCYLSHLRAMHAASKYNHYAPEDEWHLILEDDAVPSTTILEDPVWFDKILAQITQNQVDDMAGVGAINLGPNDLSIDWTAALVPQFGDQVRYAFGGKTPILPGFGTLMHAYAVSRWAAALLADELSKKRCLPKCARRSWLGTVGLPGASYLPTFAPICRGIDTDMRDLRFTYPSLFRRAFLKGPIENAWRDAGYWGQSRHRSLT